MKNRKLTNAEREEILRRTREGGKGNFQKEIATAMKLSPYRVRQVQDAAGLRPYRPFVLTTAQEKAIVELLGEGHGEVFITKTLQIPARPVREVMVRHRFHQLKGAVGYRYSFSKVKLGAIARDLRQAKRAIADKWQIPLHWLHRFEDACRAKRIEAWHKRDRNAPTFRLSLPKLAD